eukprot:TRINITY_DN11333_c0_g1_i1.p1 TRINITY_DN11333_c0_g1~~TRINITY_DN11333_c0_g1_i1.p1  ORF type:complete len:171 (+),score=28.16 TRINITY_DN11333_c0_g1_i1:2-514(+)
MGTMDTTPTTILHTMSNKQDFRNFMCEICDNPYNACKCDEYYYGDNGYYPQENYSNNRSSNYNNYSGNGNIQACKFFLEGHCRFGSDCKYAHVDAERYYDRIPSPTQSLPMSALSLAAPGGAHVASAPQSSKSTVDTLKEDIAVLERILKEKKAELARLSTPTTDNKATQ